MPWLFKDINIKLRKSETSTPTNIIFNINNKRIIKLNHKVIKQTYEIRLYNFPEYNKNNLIKIIQQYSKNSIVNIQEKLSNLPNNIFSVPAEQIKYVENALMELNCTFIIN